MNKKIICAGLLVMFQTTAFAKTILSYDEAVTMAVKNNLELNAARDALKASELNVKSTYGDFLPELNFGLSYSRLTSESKTNTKSTSQSYSSSLTLSQNLFNGFSDQASLNLALSKLLTEEANFQDTNAQINIDLKSAFAQYFYARDSLALSRDIKKRREDNLRMVELRFENGRENKGSVLLSKAYLEGAKMDLLKAENALRTSMLYLNRILNLNEDEQVELQNLPQMEAFDYASTEPDFTLLINQTPIAKKFKATLMSAEATRTQGQANFYPTWNLSGALEKTGTSFFPSDGKSFKVSTALSWSLFNGGSDYFTTTSQNLLVLSSQKRLENQMKELKRSLQESFSNYKEASLAVNVSQAFLKAAEVRSDIARSKYNNGISNFDEWDLIENELINRQKDYTLKIRDRLVALASWENAQGKGILP